MSRRSKCLVLGASLVVFGNGVYFDSKPALIFGSIFAALAILDFEMTGND